MSVGMAQRKEEDFKKIIQNKKLLMSFDPLINIYILSPRLFGHHDCLLCVVFLHYTRRTLPRVSTASAAL
jgi:hypothetical protein